MPLAGNKDGGLTPAVDLADRLPAGVIALDEAAWGIRVEERRLAWVAAAFYVQECRVLGA
jgi:hypothetical protein